MKVLSDGENGEVLRTMRVADGTTVGGMISDGQYTYSYETEEQRCQVQRLSQRI